MTQKSIYIEATGCNRRLLETEKFRRYLSANGYTICRRPEAADYILFTSCAFKDDTEEYSARRIRQLRKYGKKLMVYGCLPAISPDRYAEFEGIPSLAPKDLDRIDTFFDDILPHVEQGYVDEIVCPLQSGNDRILRRMVREHTADAYETAVRRLRRANPAMVLSTQIIAGFPGETEEEYHESIDLLARLRFDEVVVFGYADKANTAASRMAGKVGSRTIRRRVRRGIKHLRQHGIKAYYRCVD